ncbi:MAG: hypothetical protein H6523_13215 [Mycolicibacterium sp.]|nr:hypothetical protein [Mycolicibacterium sp.]
MTLIRTATVLAALSAAFLTGCAVTDEKPAAPSAFPLDRDRPTTQKPNDALSKLLDHVENLGVHCFATGGDAVAAQVRADREAKRRNSAIDAAVPAGELGPYPNSYLYISDVEPGGKCYTVTTGGMN